MYVLFLYSSPQQTPIRSIWNKQTPETKVKTSILSTDLIEVSLMLTLIRVWLLHCEEQELCAEINTQDVFQNVSVETPTQ